METSWLYVLFSLILLVLAIKNSSSWSTKQKHPPSPFPSLPFLGHLYLFKPPLHRTYLRISQKLGPIFSLKFGNRFVVVISSPTLVEECFTRNDVVLANRPRFIAGKYIGYNYTSFIGSSYGEHWRTLRRIASNELFSVARLNMFTSTREDEVRFLLRKLYKSSRDGFAIVEKLRQMLYELTFNNIMRMMAGKRYFGDEGSEENEEEAKTFRDLIEGVLKVAGVSNPADFFPFLRWIDYKGFEKNLERSSTKMDAFLQRLVDDRRQHDMMMSAQDTMIDHLLALQKSHPENYSDPIIKGIIMFMLLAGTETSVVTIEWAMSALLNHPEKLDKARSEIQNLVGNDRLVDESEAYSKLPYLQSIISETFRLFPASPLLAPHESSDDVKIGGYHVPRGTILLVNAWAIHRDPMIWDDPTSFKPERFEAQEVGPPKLMPFGMGRRSCPGMGLAQRTLSLALGSLIQCFEWQRIDETMIDLREGTGISMPKGVPLVAMCKARDILHRVLSTDI